MSSIAMSHRVVRASKFRNVYGTAWKRELCHDNIRVSKSSWDSTFCSVNPKFLAVIVESAGGGAFIVLSLFKETIGKTKSDHPVVSGHKGPVLDIAFCPHNDNIIASGSEDCSVKIWQIPDEGLTKTITEPLTALLFHQRRVGLILWHPTAQNVLLSAGSDNLVVIWNVGTSCPTIVIDSHPDVVFSACWNWNGSKFLTTCKDKKIRIIDPRSGEVEEEAICHEGSKACRAIYLKNGLVFTTGFSKTSERQYSLRAPSHLHEPLVVAEIDTSNGVMFPMYDPDTNMIYLCGKGDSVMRYFEVTMEAPYVHYISTFQTPDPQRGIGILPKRGCDVSTCEIARFYRLNSSGLCQVISMTVPRKSELFQEDLYPSTLSPVPAISAEQWLSGINEDPVLMSIKTCSQVLAFNRDENDLPKMPRHPELRRASCTSIIHPPISKTQSLPVDTNKAMMSEEVIKLRSLLTQLEHRIQALEDCKHERRIQILEDQILFLNNNCSVCHSSTSLPPNPPTAQSPVMCSGTPVTEHRVIFDEKPSVAGTPGLQNAVAMVSTFWNSPISSLSSLGTQLASPGYSLTLPSMTPFKALTALRKWVPPMQSISSFSSTLISSFSPIITRPPRSAHNKTTGSGV